MVFGLKNVPFTLEFLANDDEVTPTRMIGQKMVPILQDSDGFMGESGDIIRKIDESSGKKLFDAPPSAEALDWLSEWMPTVNALVIPRTPSDIFPEFATPLARAYFIERKTAAFGDFEALIDRTADLAAELQAGLARLELIVPQSDEAITDDLLLFPVVRALSIVRQIEMSLPLTQYRDRMSAQSGVPIIFPAA